MTSLVSCVCVWGSTCNRQQTFQLTLTLFLIVSLVDRVCTLIKKVWKSDLGYNGTNCTRENKLALNTQFQPCLLMLEKSNAEDAREGKWHYISISWELVRNASLQYLAWPDSNPGQPREEMDARASLSARQWFSDTTFLRNIPGLFGKTPISKCTPHTLSNNFRN